MEIGLSAVTAILKAARNALNLKRRLILATVLLTLLIAGVGYYAAAVSQEGLRRAIEDKSVTFAEEVMEEVDRAIHATVTKWRVFTVRPLVEQVLKQSNDQFEQMADAEAYIDDQDRQWRAAQSTPLLQELLANPLSEALRRDIDACQRLQGYRVFGEVFITNRYGANAAQTGKTSDYRQNDEEWWQRAKADGVYITDVSFDESAGVYSTDVCVRVDDPQGQFVGVVKAVANIQGIFSILEDRADSGANAPCSLILLAANGKVIFPARYNFQDGSQFHPHHVHSREVFERTDEEFGPVIASCAVSRGYRDYQGLGWSLLVNYKAQEILAPARGLRRSILAISVGIMCLGLASGLWLTASLSRRIERIKGVAVRFGKGELSARIADGSADEIGQLGRFFNQMAADVQHYSRELEDKAAAMEARNELLEIEIVDRQTAQLELVKANEQLRQAQMDLVQSEKMSMLGQLVGGVAHEINTPIAAILNVMADARDHLRAMWEATESQGQLPEEARSWLGQACRRVLGRTGDYGEAGSRAVRRQIEQELTAKGCDGARRLAGVILGCFGEGWRDEARLLEHLSMEPVREVLEHMVALRTSTDISLTSARKIARIVQALRYYSHAGQDELSDLNVNDSIDSTLVILQSRIKRIAEVQVTFDPALPPVRCGPDISQVWTNVIDNACDALGERRGEGAGHIEVVTCRQDNWIVVRISNDGPTIPEDVTHRIFDPFFTTKPVGKGTGLGLGICQGILRRCGGSIEAINEPERVTFEVRLPIVAKASGEQARGDAEDFGGIGNHHENLLASVTLFPDGASEETR